MLGGCTNGGGQIKIDDLSTLQGHNLDYKPSQKEWLSIVDEAYYSTEDSEPEPTSDDDSAVYLGESEELNLVNDTSSNVKSILLYWESYTGISLDRLIRTSFKEVHSDVGKPKKTDTERVAEVAIRIGGGW